MGACVFSGKTEDAAWGWNGLSFGYPVAGDLTCACGTW